MHRIPLTLPLPSAGKLVLLFQLVIASGCLPMKGSPKSELDSLGESSEFFSDPGSQALSAYKQMQGSADAELMKYIADNTVSRWLVGGTPSAVGASVKSLVEQAAVAQKIPVLVAYNIPNRDCGNYSAGGAASATQYLQWIDAITQGIGSEKAYVILEPDFLPLNCAANSYGLIKSAVEKLKSAAQAKVYIDIGHAAWLNADEAAKRLSQSGIEIADGFSVNVSNFHDDKKNIDYGLAIREKVQKNFVIDTSRNGNGATPNNQWCNPAGRALGRPSTTQTGVNGVDAFIWIKAPGESDGTCGGHPSAGAFMRDKALQMARSTNRSTVQTLPPADSPIEMEKTISTPDISPQVARVGGYTCEQQKGWGKCREPWMHPVCSAVCGSVATGASRRAGLPGTGSAQASVGGYTCEQQKGWGKCREPWMHPVCTAVCRRR